MHVSIQVGIGLAWQHSWLVTAWMHHNPCRRRCCLQPPLLLKARGGGARARGWRSFSAAAATIVPTGGSSSSGNRGRRRRWCCGHWRPAVSSEMGHKLEQVLEVGAARDGRNIRDGRDDRDGGGRVQRSSIIVPALVILGVQSVLLLLGWRLKCAWGGMGQGGSVGMWHIDSLAH